MNCFSLLSGFTNASLVWYVVILWDGHRLVALVRIIKHAGHMHLHHILHCLQWSSTWHIFLRYWHLRLMWHALSWLHDIPGHTMLFYLVISSSCDLVIMLHYSYLFRMSHVHYIHVTPYMHGLVVHDLSSWLFLLLLLPSVLDTTKHIILMSYLRYYIFIFSLLLFFSLHVLLLVCFCRTFILFFQYLDQKPV